MPTRALVSVACAHHSWTLNSSTVRPAAPPKPPWDTMHAFTPLGPRCHHGTQRTHGSTIQIGWSFHCRCCPRTQRGSRRVCGIFQCSSSLVRRGTSGALIVKFHIYRHCILDFRGQGIVCHPWCGQQMIAHTQQSPEHHNTQQTWQHPAMVNKLTSLQHRWKHGIQVSLL